MPAIEGRQRDEVEQRQEEVEGGQHHEEGGPQAALHQLAADAGGTHHGHGAIDVAVLAKDGGHDSRNLRRELGNTAHRGVQHVAGVARRGREGVDEGVGLHDVDDLIGHADRAGVNQLALSIEALDGSQRDIEVTHGPVAFYLQRDGLSRVRHCYIAHLGKGLHGLPVERQHDIARLHAGLARWAETLARLELALRVLVRRACDLANARAHVGVRVRQARGHGNNQQDDKAQHQVDGDATGHDQHPLPCRLFVHRVRFLFLGEELVLGRHARDVTETTHGKSRQAVFGVAAAKRRHAGAEADKEAAHAHPEGAGGEHVAGLVQGHGDSDA